MLSYLLSEQLLLTQIHTFYLCVSLSEKAIAVSKMI